MDNNVRGAITASILKSNEVWPELSGKKLEFVTPVEGVIWGHSSNGALNWIKIDGLWGFYDSDSGDFVIPPKYRSIRVLTGSMFQVWEGERWGIIDTDSLEISWNS